MVSRCFTWPFCSASIANRASERLSSINRISIGRPTLFGSSNSLGRLNAALRFANRGYEHFSRIYNLGGGPLDFARVTVSGKILLIGLFLMIASPTAAIGAADGAVTDCWTLSVSELL